MSQLIKDIEKDCKTEVTKEEYANFLDPIVGSVVVQTIVEAGLEFKISYSIITDKVVAVKSCLGEGSKYWLNH